MSTGDDLDVKALLQRLQPAQRHADAGIGFAGRNRFQQLIGRTAEIDQFNIEILLGEKPLIDCHRQLHRAHRAGIPRYFQLARCAGQGRHIGRRLADRKLREIDRRCLPEGKRLRAPDRCRATVCGDLSATAACDHHPTSRLLPAIGTASPLATTHAFAARLCAIVKRWNGSVVVKLFRLAHLRIQSNENAQPGDFGQ
jgi:hypothetical protein